MIYKTDFGQFITEQRYKHSLKSNELAEMLNISKGYLSQLEHGKRVCPDQELLNRMIEVFDLDVEDINVFYDLYAEASGMISPDIAEYIRSNPTVRKALRFARDASISDEHWERFIESIKNEQ